MSRLRRFKVKGGGKGFRDLLIGQFLLIVLLYVSVAFHEAAREVTMVMTFVLLAGILYFSWRGMKELWRKKGSKSG